MPVFPFRTPSKSLRFVAYNQGRLRKLFHFVQTRVMEIRQHYQQAAQAAQTQQYVAYASQLTDSQSGQPAFGTPQPQQSMTIPQHRFRSSQRGPSHRLSVRILVCR